jgi:antitoxin PrlF
MQLHYFVSKLSKIFAPMPITLTPCSESTLTDRYQTTVPAPVRKFLGLNKNDKICYTILPDGTVAISRAEKAESDPSLKPFLDFLAQDIENNPQQLQLISPDLIDRVQSLVSEVDFDINELLVDEDE